VEDSRGGRAEIGSHEYPSKEALNTWICVLQPSSAHDEVSAPNGGYLRAGHRTGRTAERDRCSGPRTDRIAGYLRLSALHRPGRDNATRVVAATRSPPG
jgi:hypothetical protein